MDGSDYVDLINFISNGVYPEQLRKITNKSERNKRDNYRSQSTKFFIRAGEVFRYEKGIPDGLKVVRKEEVSSILKDFHGSSSGGHTGFNKTRDAINKRFWWRGMSNDIRTYVKTCLLCQKSDPLKPPKQPELKQIKVSHPFELMGVDLVGPLPTTKAGNKYIFTATDYFTKWVEAFPMPSKSGSSVASCFKKIFARHGAVNAILTDQGREFLNDVNECLMREWKVEHRVAAAYHPQTNGLDEKTNQTIKTSLRKLVNDNQDDWDDHLDGVLFSIRSKPHCSTKYSPFFLLYGREAVYPSQLPKTMPDVDQLDVETDIDNFLLNRQEDRTATYKTAQSNMDKAHDKQKKDYNRRHGKKVAAMKVGDKVLLYNAKKTPSRKGNLQPNYLGPYHITSLEGKAATLANDKGDMKTSQNIDNLKKFCQREESTELKSQDWIHRLESNGDLLTVLRFVKDLKPPKLKRGNLLQALSDCPMQTFLDEITPEIEAGMDEYTPIVLPHAKTMAMNLETLVSVTMLTTCMCVKSRCLDIPVTKLMLTLQKRPLDFDLDDLTPEIPACNRLSVGGETLERVDLDTLKEGEWLNDKIINSFLGLLRAEANSDDLELFVFPSYISLLWEKGDFDHWLFKKVKFSLYKKFLVPVNQNENHWMLLYIDNEEKTITLLDSLGGNSAHHWISLWRQFIEKRNTCNAINEELGPWTPTENRSSRQQDGHSCGVFTLMNAECIAKRLPVTIMRQVHCKDYRQYVLQTLISQGSRKDEYFCDMPGCKGSNRLKQWVQCSVCGRWMHLRCIGKSLSVVQKEDYVCCICVAKYF